MMTAFRFESFARAFAPVEEGKERKTMKEKDENRIARTPTIEQIATTLTIAQIDAIQDQQRRVNAINQHLSELFAALVWPGPGGKADDVAAAD
jgi:hypothetical protein